MENKEKRKSLGRRKIEIKKIEKKNNLQVTFSKRRKGLFKKAGELSVLCGVDVVVLVQSPAGKIHSFGIVDRYLKGDYNENLVDISMRTSSTNNALFQVQAEECLEVTKKLIVEKEIEKAMEENNANNAKGFWWDLPNFYHLDLYELKLYWTAMEALKKNVMARVHEQSRANAITAAASSLLIPNTSIDYFGGLPVPHHEDIMALMQLNPWNYDTQFFT